MDLYTFVLGKQKARSTGIVAERRPRSAWREPFHIYEMMTEVVGKDHPDHPDPYSALLELRVHRNMSARTGFREVKYGPTKKWRDLQSRIENIATEYDNMEILDYLRTLGYNIEL